MGEKEEWHSSSAHKRAECRHRETTSLWCRYRNQTQDISNQQRSQRNSGAELTLKPPFPSPNHEALLYQTASLISLKRLLSASLCCKHASHRKKLQICKPLTNLSNKETRNSERILGKGNAFLDSFSSTQLLTDKCFQVLSLAPFHSTCSPLVFSSAACSFNSHLQIKNSQIYVSQPDFSF